MCAVSFGGSIDPDLILFIICPLLAGRWRHSSIQVCHRCTVIETVTKLLHTVSRKFEWERRFHESPTHRIVVPDLSRWSLAAGLSTETICAVRADYILHSRRSRACDSEAKGLGSPLNQRCFMSTVSAEAELQRKNERL
jgi:hypothetical protein